MCSAAIAGMLETAPEENLALMRVSEQLSLQRPFYGAPRTTAWLQELGYAVNHKQAERLMRMMSLQATVPGPHTSCFHLAHRVYSYLLRESQRSSGPARRSAPI